MVKKEQNAFNIFTESVGLYFSNFPKLMKYMTFPVLGQYAGLGLVFLITYFYLQLMPPLIEKYEFLNNFYLLLILPLVITLPGLAIFMKAFWEFLVAYGSINSMVENMQKSGKLYDFSAHTELVKRRSFQFVLLWLLFGVFTTLAICPLLWIVCGILTIYFVLIFQVFTFEPEETAIGCIKRSLQLVKGHFVQTFLLYCLIGILTYSIIPHLFTKLLTLCGIENLLAQMFNPLTSQLALPDLTPFGLSPITGNDIAILVIQSIVAQILIQYTLPLRSIMWSLWYKNLNNGSSNSLQTKSSKKKPSEKLMEESHKKYGKKKLDTNILKRASEKED